MAQYMNFVGVDKTLDIAINIDRIERMQIQQSTKLVLFFATSVIELLFDKKKPLASELMDSIIAGDTNLDRFKDSITGMRIR